MKRQLLCIDRGSCLHGSFGLGIVQLGKSLFDFRCHPFLKLKDLLVLPCESKLYAASEADDVESILGDYPAVHSLMIIRMIRAGNESDIEAGYLDHLGVHEVGV